jgi:hypothetical protein
MARSLPRPSRRHCCPQLEALEERAVPALLAATTLGEGSQAERVSDSIRDVLASLHAGWSSDSARDAIAAVVRWTGDWQDDVRVSGNDQDDSSSGPSTSGTGVTPTPGSTRLSDDLTSQASSSAASSTVTPGLPTAVSTGSISTPGSGKGEGSTTSSSLIAASAASTVPVTLERPVSSAVAVTAVSTGSNSTGGGHGDGSSGETKGASSSSSAASAPQGTASAVERSTAPAAFIFFQPASSATGGTRGTDPSEGDGYVGTKGDWSGRQTALAVESLSGQTGEAQSSDLFPLTAAAGDLPAERDLPTASDIALGLVGGRPRADVLPQRGSQLSVVATVVTAAEPVAGDSGDANALASLFVGPLNESLMAGALVSADLAEQMSFALPTAEPAGRDLGGMTTGLLLTTTGVLGALLWGLRRKDPLEEEKADLLRV